MGIFGIFGDVEGAEGTGWLLLRTEGWEGGEMPWIG